MSLNETIPARNDYVSSGGTDYAFTFKVYDQAHLAVYKDGAVQTLNTHYRVRNGASPFTALANTSLPSDGFIQFLDVGGGVDTLDNGIAVAILRDQPMEQQSEYAGEPFPPARLEKDYDKVVMLIQQLEEVLGRSLRAPAGDTARVDPLPTQADRASKYAAYDADGNPIATSGTTSDIMVSAFAETFLDDVDGDQVMNTIIADQTDLGEALAGDDQIPYRNLSGDAGGRTTPIELAAFVESNFEADTWVPSAGEVDTVYTTRLGFFTKVGNVVHISCWLEIDTIASGSTVQISGLPYTVKNGCVFTAPVFYDGIASNVVDLIALATSNQGFVTLRSSLAAGDALSSSNDILGDGATILFSGSYLTE